MERKELFECLRIRKPVIYDEGKYIPQAYILRPHKNTWLHSVELLDMRSKTIVIAPLDKIYKQNL